jgi:predicted dehydrogenase
VVYLQGGKMEPLRLGFIGAGAMATFAIYPALHFAPIALQAVCDLDETRARNIAGKFGPGRWYTDYQQMWATEDLEAVIIHMHPGPRQTIVREALEAGYHVFIPKPPALSLADSLELASLARQTGKTLMVNFQRRFSFGVTQARKMMADPAFGQFTSSLARFAAANMMTPGVGATTGQPMLICSISPLIIWTWRAILAERLKSWPSSITNWTKPMLLPWRWNSGMGLSGRFN